MIRLGRSQSDGVVGALFGAAFGVFALLMATISALFMGTVTVLPLAVIPRGKRERWAMIPTRWWAERVVRGLLGVRVRIEGEVQLQPSEGALVLCNHRSWLDPVLLMAYTRSNGLSKGAIFWLPVLGLYGWLAGAVFFDRNSAKSRAQARREVLELVRAGHRLHVFPEGTRTRTGELGERVYLLLAMDCWKEKLPVVCCAVWGTERVLPPDVFGCWPMQEATLRIGATLRPEDFPDSRAFARACWEQVKQLVEEAKSLETSPERESNPHSLSGRGF